MKINEAAAIQDIVLSEGPEINVNPPGTPPGTGEPGGASKYGISVTAYGDFSAFFHMPPATVEIVSALTEPEAEAFYSGWIMPKMRFDDLQSGVDYRVFDVVTNLGQAGGTRCIEIAMGVYPVTGVMSDALVAAINAADPKILIPCIGAAWMGIKSTQPSWGADQHGWNNRRLRVDAQALTMTGAPNV